jgi:hypothetical protein
MKVNTGIGIQGPTLLLAACAAALIGGCGVEATLRHHRVSLELAAAGDAELALAVHDQRPYVRSEEKIPAYVGSLRKAGIPYDAHTASGRALAADMARVVERALAERGFSIRRIDSRPAQIEIEVVKRLAASGAARSLLLAVREWHADVRSEQTLLKYDLGLKVINAYRTVVAETSLRGEQELPGRPDIALPRAYREKLEALLNAPAVVAALSGPPAERPAAEHRDEAAAGGQAGRASAETGE